MNIPLWVVASLGKRVELVNEFVGPCESYPAMHQGVLDGIQYDEASDSCYALVALDVDDLSYLENFSFAEIRAANGLAPYAIANGDVVC